MAKFLGVISNSAKTFEQQVLEFSDLELLTDYLLNETQNLCYEFSEKLKFISDHEVLILENSNKLVEIYNYLLVVRKKMLIIETEINEIGCCLSEMETVLSHVHISSHNFACNCEPNKERDRILNLLVQISEDVHRMDKQIEETKEHECFLSTKNRCDLLNVQAQRLIPFLDIHTRILLQIENKSSRISDLLKNIEEMFFYAKKRFMYTHFHKSEDHNASDC